MNEFIKINNEPVNINYLHLGKRTHLANGLGGCSTLILESTIKAYDKQKTLILDWEDNYCLELPKIQNHISLFADYQLFDDDSYFLLTHIICAMLDCIPTEQQFTKIKSLVRECVVTNGVYTDLNKIHKQLKLDFGPELPLENLRKYTNIREFGYVFNAYSNTFLDNNQAVSMRISELDTDDLIVNEIFINCCLFCMLTLKNYLVIITEELLAEFRNSFPDAFYQRLVTKIGKIEGSVIVHTLNLSNNGKFVDYYKSAAEVSYIIHPDNTPELAKHPLWDPISQGYVTRDIKFMAGVCIYSGNKYEDVVWRYQE